MHLIQSIKAKLHGLKQWKSYALLLLGMALAGSTAGCIPLGIAFPTPPMNSSSTRTNVDDASLPHFKPGTDNIEDVMLRLGEPDEVSANERELVYCSRKYVGFWVVVVVMGAAAGGTGGPFTRDEFFDFRLDQAGRFTNCIIEHKWGAKSEDFTESLLAAPSLDWEGKKFKPEPDKANIYVVRKGGAFDTGRLVPMVLDGYILGDLDSGRYQLLSVAPGKHLLETSSDFENFEKRFNTHAQIQVNAEAGTNYFIDVSFSHVWTSWRVNIRQIGDAEGQKDVANCKRAEVNHYQ